MSICIQTHFGGIDFDEMLAASQRQSDIAHELEAKQGMPFITAYIVAGDIMSAEKADKVVADGADPMDVYARVGSYARFDWCVKNLKQADLLKLLPSLWTAADPDDTNPQYLKLWQDAFIANQYHTVTDGKKLPKKKRRIRGQYIVLTVYRGQVGDTLGISWTTERSVAEKFARTGGGRQEIAGGRVLTGTVPTIKVLAYLTSRSEFEVIVDPKDVEIYDEF